MYQDFLKGGSFTTTDDRLASEYFEVYYFTSNGKVIAGSRYRSLNGSWIGH